MRTAPCPERRAQSRACQVLPHFLPTEERRPNSKGCIRASGDRAATGRSECVTIIAQGHGQLQATRNSNERKTRCSIGRRAVPPIATSLHLSFKIGSFCPCVGRTRSLHCLVRTLNVTDLNPCSPHSASSASTSARKLFRLTTHNEDVSSDAATTIRQQGTWRHPLDAMTTNTRDPGS